MMQKIFLRPMEKKDAGIVAEWFNDSDNIGFMGTAVRHTEHTAKSVWYDIVEMRKLDPDYEHLFMVCLEGEKEPIGHAGIDEADMNDLRGEIFLLIGKKEHKGKGYGPMIINLLLDYAFGKLGFNTLFATVCVENIAAMKTTERAGFKRIGIRREYNKIGGRFVDEIFYDLTRKEYLESIERKKQ
jgi:RimJ/RimL family protein N-acetyltransferase